MNHLIIILMFMSSINFTQMNHPLSMGINLLIQTILMSILCSFYTSSYWFSYILFLIMLGGMLVLFIYVTSLASNELFLFSMNNFMKTFFFIIMLMMLSYFLDMFIFTQMNMESNQFMNMFNNMENEYSLIKLYNNSTMNITLLMINYLFLTLIMIVKITNFNYGSLRQFN